MNAKAREETSSYLQKLSERKGHQVTLEDLQRPKEEEKECEDEEELLKKVDAVLESNVRVVSDPPDHSNFDKEGEEIVIVQYVDGKDTDSGASGQNGNAGEEMSDDLLKQVIFQIK